MSVASGKSRIVFAVRAVAAIFAVCAGATAGGSGNRTTPRIKRIELYGGGLMTGRITLHFADASLVAIGYLVQASGSRGIPMMRAMASQREINQVRRLMDDWHLRAFVPSAQWFRQTPPKHPSEGSADMLIVWSDKRVVLRLPPSDARLRVPREARRLYASLDQICDLLLAFTEKHARCAETRPTMVAPESAEWTAFEGELHRVWKESLPKDRRGW